MPLERLPQHCSDWRGASSSFPFVNIALRSPLTPIRNPRPSISFQDAAQTHPIDDPLYPPPFYGLSFSNAGNGTLAREGALVLEDGILSAPSTPPGNSLGEGPATYFEGWFYFC